MKRMLSGLVVVAIFLGSFGAWAQEEIWDGGGAAGGDANWGTAANWFDDSTPVALSSLIFSGALDVANTNNLAGNVARFAWLSFSNSQFTTFGNPFTITSAGGMTNFAAANQLYYNTITAQVAQTWNSALATRTMYFYSNIVMNGNLTLTGAGNFEFRLPTNTAVAAQLTGAGALYVGITSTPGSAIASVWINHTNTYAGGTFITASNRVILQNSGKLGSGSVIISPGGQLYLTAAASLNNSLSLQGNGPQETGTGGFLGALRLESGSTINGIVTAAAPARINVYTANDSTINGQIIGSSTLQKTGVGNLVLNNLTNLGFTGKWEFYSNGIVRARSDTSLGAVPGVYTADAITLNNGARLMNNSTPLVIHANRGITLASTGGGIQSGWWTDVKVNSVITGAGALAINADSTPGWVVLAGQNTFNGNLTIDGRLRLGVDNALPNGAGKGNVQLNPGNAFLSPGNLRVMDMNGFSDTINALNGGGALTNSRGNAVLTFGDNNASGSFTGSVAAVAGGSLRLVKIGAGAQSLLADIRNGVGLHVDSGFLLTTGSYGGGVSVDAGGILVTREAAPGRISTPGTMALTNAAVSFKPGGATPGLDSDLFAANDLVLDGTVDVYVTPLKDIGAGSYLLFSYTNSIVGSAASLNVQPAGTRYTGFTASDVANGIAITAAGGGPATLNFIGTNASWNVTNAASFYNAGSASTDVFYHADTVIFGADVSTNVVNLTGALAPENVIVEGPTNLTFQGSGRLSGLANITKGGTNILTMSNANDFDGTVVVTGGVLRVNNAMALGSTLGATWVTNGGTLDVNGQNLGAEDFYLGGAGAGGTGAVINASGTDATLALQRVTLVADTVIGNSRRMDIRSQGILWPTNNAFLRTDGGAYSVTKLGTADFAMHNVDVSGVGDWFINQGLVRYEYGTRSMGVETGVIHIANGATFDMYQASNTLYKNVHIPGTGRLWAQQAASANLNVLAGTLTLDGAGNVDSPSHLTLAGTVDGTGQMLKNGTGTLYLTGTNTWSGGLTINAGSVNLGKSGTTGDLGVGPVTNNSNLYLTRVDTYTVGNEIVGPRTALIAKQNLGTLILDGVTTGYLGNIQLQNGTLLIGPNFVSGTNQLEFTSTNAVIASSDGTGRIVSNYTVWSQGPNIGAGGDLTFSGVTHNNGGASKAMSVSNSLTRFTGTLTGAGTVAKRGPGELVFENTVAVSAFTNLEGRLTLTGAGAFTHATAALTFGAGSVFDVAGVTGGWYLRQGQTLRGDVGIIGDSLISNSFVRPGASAGTITFSNDVTFSNADVEFELAGDGTPGAGVNDYIETIGNLTLSGITTTRVGALNNSFAPSYVLWTNGGTRTGGAANLLLANVGIMTNSRYGFAISDADPQQIVLNVTGSAKTLAWQGGATGFWSVKGTTNNFLDGVTPDTFWQADAVSFGGDSTRRTVTIAEPVAPALVTVSAPYTLNLAGSGKITGGATLYKTGEGALIVNGAMDFTGATLISNGIVQARNGTALGSAAGATYVAANGTLDAYGQNLGYEHVFAVGAGYTNGGAIVNLSGVAQIQTLRRVTLTGDTTFGGLSTWDLRGSVADSWLSTGGNAFNLIKVGTNTVRLVDVAVDAALADIEIRQGILGFEATTSGLGDPMRTLTVYGNASLWLNSMNARVDKNIVLRDGAGIWLQGGTVGASQNFFVQPVVLSNGMARIDGGANALFTEFTGDGGLRKLGGGEVWLTGTNDFTGQFRMSAGTLRLLSNGTMNAVSGILMEGGTFVIENARMKVDGRVNDAADITAWGGTITYQAATNAATAETLGNVRVERGSLTLNMDIPTSYGTTATVYIAGISQEQGILNFQHSNNGTYWLGRTPTNDCGPHFIVGGLTNGQTIPWATVNGAGFARYNTTNGIWAPLETEEFNAAADQTGQDLRFTFERDGAVDVLTANRSINTIVVSNQYDSFIDLAGNNLTLEGSGFRQIGANNFMITNSGGGGSLIAGDAVFFVNSATTRLAAATGLASLDKEGGGTLILLGAHTYTGRTAIGGTLQVGEDGAASIPTDAPVYNHGTLRFQTTTDHDFTANIQGLGSIVKYGNNTLTLSGTSNMVGSSFNIYSGSVTFASGSATYMTNNGGQLAIGSLNTGPISTMTIEPGALLDLGAYTPFYATHWAANSHTLINQDGGTFIVGTTNMQGFRLAHYSQDSTGIYNMANGLLVVSNRLTVAWDGRGFFNQSNGTVKVGQIALTPLDGGNRARTSQWNLVNGTLMLGQGGMTAYTNFPAQQFNVSGGTLMAWKTNTQVSQRIPVNLLGTMTVDGVAGDTVEMLGRASGAGGILKIGEGTAILAGTNTYGGGTTISNGTLVAKTFNALGSGDVTLSGGTLNLSLAGLNSADLPGNFNQRTNPVATVELGTSLAHFEQNVSGGTLSINTTAGYHGFLVVGGPTNVTYTFAESFDDNVMLRIISAGATNTVLNNGSWNTPTKGTITLAPGLHEFDLRLGNGAGGGGANAASWWTSWTMGFGYDPQGRDQEIGNNYLTMRDPGDGSLFLSDTQGFTVANAVNVTADSAISLIGAGGAKMTMSGAFGIGAQRLTVTNNMAGMLDLLGDMTLTGSPTFDIATNVTVTAAGAIGGGANGINKDGPGVLRLTGISTYAGTTRVMAGAVELADFGAIGSSATLQIDAGAKLVATNLAAGTLHLLAGQTLQGHGTFEGGLITDAGSTVRPGSSPGALTMVGDLTADAGSTFTFELNGTTAVTQYDQLLFGGGNVATLTLNGPTLQVLLGFTPSYGTVFEIVSGFGTLAGTPGEFDSRPDGSTFTVNTTEFQIDYNANDITLTVVPEPSSLGLVGLLGLLGWLNRRRMRSR